MNHLSNGEISHGGRREYYDDLQSMEVAVFSNTFVLCYRITLQINGCFFLPHREDFYFEITIVSYSISYDIESYDAFGIMWL